MCIRHDPELLERWRFKNKDVIIAYKVILHGGVYQFNNESLVADYSWSVGIHKVNVAKLNEFGHASAGFYVYADKQDAFREKNYQGTDGACCSGAKVIVVYINPQDVIYAGHQDDYFVLVCRQVEVKSLNGIKE